MDNKAADIYFGLLSACHALTVSVHAAVSTVNRLFKGVNWYLCNVSRREHERAAWRAIMRKYAECCDSVLNYVCVWLTAGGGGLWWWWACQGERNSGRDHSPSTFCHSRVHSGRIQVLSHTLSLSLSHTHTHTHTEHGIIIPQISVQVDVAALAVTGDNMKNVIVIQLPEISSKWHIHGSVVSRHAVCAAIQPKIRLKTVSNLCI